MSKETYLIFDRTRGNQHFMMNKNLCLGIFFLMCTFLHLQAQSIVINEVMSNVKGSDSGVGSPGDRNEFVELYNASLDTVDLSLYRVSDIDAMDAIIVWEDTLLADPDAIYGTTLLPPGEFAIILDPEYTSTGNGKYLQPYDFPEKTLIVTVGNTTIGDGLSTNDPVVLLDSSDCIVSSYGTPMDTSDNLPYDPGDGISAERIFPLYPDGEAYWSSCSDSNGSTPGAPNSCFSNVAIIVPPSKFIVSPEEIMFGGMVNISAILQNQTSDTIKSINANFFEDTNWDSVCSSSEVIASFQNLGPIPPFGGSLRIYTKWKPSSEGNKKVGVNVEGINKSNVFKMLKAGEPIGEIVINEIMYNPVNGGEWLEIFNRGKHNIDLLGWQMGVGKEKICIAKNHLTISPSGYVVIAKNLSLFESKWGNPSYPIIEPVEWIAFSNKGDTISIMDNSNFLFDELCYKDISDKGVSIERVTTEARSSEDWNWGGCCDYRGATPGKKNSIFAPSSDKKTLLSIIPNPFSPNGDGYQERTVISYELPFYKAKVDLSLYTRSGIKICCFLKQQDSGKEGMIVWNGRDKNGGEMPVGLYIVYLEAVDKSTGERVVKKKSLVIAGRR